VTDGAAINPAARPKTPVQIGRHSVCAFEAGFEDGIKPMEAGAGGHPTRTVNVRSLRGPRLRPIRVER
jgi:hypothetical protein